MRHFRMMEKDDGTGGGGDTTRYVTVEQLNKFGRDLVSTLRSGGQNFNQPAARNGGGSTADRVRSKLLRDAKAERDTQQKKIDELSTQMSTFQQAADDAQKARTEAASGRALSETIGQYIVVELAAMKTDGYAFAQQAIEDHHFDNAFARIVSDRTIDFDKNEEIEKAVKAHFVNERMALAPTAGAGGHHFAQTPGTNGGNGNGAVVMTAATGNELVDKHRDNPAHFEAAQRAVQQFAAVNATMEPGELTIEKFIDMAVEDPTIVEIEGDPWLSD